MTLREFLKLVAETPDVPGDVKLDDFFAIAAYRLARRRWQQRRAAAS